MVEMKGWSENAPSVATGTACAEMFTDFLKKILNKLKWYRSWETCQQQWISVFIPNIIVIEICHQEVVITVAPDDEMVYREKGLYVQVYKSAAEYFLGFLEKLWFH